MTHQVYLAAKRIFDFVFAILAIVITLPILTLTAILIKLDSKGPVLYLGRRSGPQGHFFYIYKFRTMHPDAEKLGTTTQLGDPRITRVGRYIRKFKIDEFPQFFNVLVGNMSFVGPRPEVEEHTSEYTEEEQVILTVKPGITDYASITFSDLQKVLGSEDPHGKYVREIRSIKNQLRVKYVREQSFITDLKIIFLTIVVIIKKFIPEKADTASNVENYKFN